MNTRRVLPIGLGVTALLVLAGIASHGRPLSGSGGGPGPTAGFFDYVLTTVVIAAVLAFAIAAYVVAGNVRGSKFTPPTGRFTLLSTFISIAIALALVYLLHRSHLLDRIQHLEERGVPGNGVKGRTLPAGAKHTRGARIRWDEVLLVVALVVVGLLVFARRARGPLRPALRLRATDALVFALDESLDDLRTDPDLRRAIIAAYARMERALGRARTARRPSEAPFEYLERVLGTLDASGGSVRRLTALFEWAKFSQHEPDAAMRDEAIEALVAVRDELRPPAAAA